MKGDDETSKLCTKPNRPTKARDKQAKGRRTKPTLQALQASVVATDEHYSALAATCVQAILLREKSILVECPYFIKFDETFPKGILVSNTVATNTYKMRARKVLAWLYERGLSKLTAEDVVKGSRKAATALNAIERKIDGILDVSLPANNDVE